MTRRLRTCALVASLVCAAGLRRCCLHCGLASAASSLRGGCRVCMAGSRVCVRLPCVWVSRLLRGACALCGGSAFAGCSRACAVGRTFCAGVSGGLLSLCGDFHANVGGRACCLGPPPYAADPLSRGGSRACAAARTFCAGFLRWLWRFLSLRGTSVCGGSRLCAAAPCVCAAARAFLCGAPASVAARTFAWGLRLAWLARTFRAACAIAGWFAPCGRLARLRGGLRLRAARTLARRLAPCAAVLASVCGSFRVGVEALVSACGFCLCMGALVWRRGCFRRCAAACPTRRSPGKGVPVEADRQPLWTFPLGCRRAGLASGPRCPP
jgi:hypothetical protein